MYVLYVLSLVYCTIVCRPTKLLVLSQSDHHHVQKLTHLLKEIQSSEKNGMKKSIFKQQLSNTFSICLCSITTLSQHDHVK